MSILQKMSVIYTFVAFPIVSLSPLNFIVRVTDLNWNLLALASGTERSWEIVLNILLYLPFGFGIGSYLFSKGFKFSKILALILVTSFLVSYCFEVLQSFLPSRFPSWRDVGANVLGGILGSLCIFVSERRIVSFLLPSYVVAGYFLSLAMQQEVTFGIWNEKFLLLVGNEHTGDRPWKGSVPEFFIAGRAATQSEVREIVAQRDPKAFSSNSWVAYYIKRDGLEGYRDALNNSPPLMYKEDSKKRFHWFESTEPARRVTQDLARNSQFTLGAIVNTEDNNQKGPARIISLSEDTGQRNFTLGQEGADLVFRLRTPLTGANGTDRYLKVPAVFATSNARHIVITFDGTTVLAYLDGMKSLDSLELAPVLAAYPFFHLVHWPAVKVAKVIYYGVIFLPVGIMLALLMLERNRRLSPRMIVLGTALLGFCCLGLELLLVLVSGRNAQVGNILLATLVSLAAFLSCLSLANRMYLT